MTPREAAVIGAYTGILVGPFEQLHKYIEELIGGPVWTHEIPLIREEIKQKSKEEFMKITTTLREPQNTAFTVLLEPVNAGDYPEIIGTYMSLQRANDVAMAKYKELNPEGTSYDHEDVDWGCFYSWDGKTQDVVVRPSKMDYTL